MLTNEKTVEREIRSAPPAASAAERFLAIASALDSAARGGGRRKIDVGGNDQLARLAHNVNQLFDMVQERRDNGDAATLRELEKSNTRLEYLIANTPAIIYSSVPTGDFKMTFVSANAARVLDYQPEEMLADPNFWFEHIHPEDIPRIFSSLAQIFSEGQRTYEYRFRTRDGRYLWMHDSLRLIRDSAGNPLEIIGSLTDITDRKTMEEALQRKGDEQQALIEKLQQAQAQLLQSEKMASIGQLAAGVAHEINNPVGFVNSNMGTLCKYVETLFGVVQKIEELALAGDCGARNQALLQQIREDADLEFLKEDTVQLVRESMEGLTRVTHIVQSLKDFSHVGEIDWQFADLHHGLDSTLMIAANEIKYKARVDRQYGKLPLVKCLASELNQVFMNLIVNASQAIRGSGVITISTECRGKQVTVTIEDNGEGIPAENLGRIFNPFFTTKPVGQGTGLGLSLSYNIVAKHGGRIDVQSEPGLGTRFVITLPVDGPTGSGT
jgi:PAS domain S-box-containing protein